MGHTIFIEFVMILPKSDQRVGWLGPGAKALFNQRSCLVQVSTNAKLNAKYVVSVNFKFGFRLIILNRILFDKYLLF